MRPWKREPNGQTVEIKMPFVVFATPSFDKRVSLEFHCSGLETQRLLIQRGISHGYIPIGGDRYLENVRNKLATRFLTEYPDATDLFFLDDDVGYPAAKVIQFLIRPEPVLAGVYPSKNDNLDFPVALLGDTETGALIENGGMYAVSNVGAGFLRIKRGVLERLAEISPRYRESPEGPEIINIFSAGMGDDGLFWGEDYVFVQKCRSLGIDVWIDPDIAFSHSGPKAWKAKLSDHMDIFREKAMAQKAAAVAQDEQSDEPASDYRETGTAYQAAAGEAA